MANDNYLNLSPEIRREALRGTSFYLGVEMYLPTWDDIYSQPEMAVFRFSDSRFTWEGNKYRDSIKAIPELAKFIGRQFNTLNLSMMNVERGVHSGSSLAFKHLIRGFRIGVRIIFPKLEGIDKSRLVWWGRVNKTENLNEDTLGISCSQEIGDFSYEVATDQYGQSCPLYFGKGDCLGTESLEDKSLLYQRAFANFGQGGCNRTWERCHQFDKSEGLPQTRFYQGQRKIAVSGNFTRQEEVEVKKFFIFKSKKKIYVPVAWASKNIADSSNINIPIAFGRIKMDLTPITWADIGERIVAIMGAAKGSKQGIEGFYNITSQNPKLRIESVTQHLGTYGGVLTQFPDGRFPTSDYHSRLSFLGITFSGSEPANEGEDTPKTSAVLKAALVPVRNKFGEFVYQWSNNPVWISRYMATDFPYTVIKKEWFDEDKNEATAKKCFRVVEDDTSGDIATISSSEQQNFADGRWTRFRSTSRYNAAMYEAENGYGQLNGLPLDILSTPQGGIDSPDSLSPYGEYIEEIQIVRETQPPRGGVQNPIEIIPGTSPANQQMTLLPANDQNPDIEWYNVLESPIPQVQRTYLQHEFTANGVVNSKSKLVDILHSFLFPTFRGYWDFDQFGKISIAKREAADNSFIRLNTPRTGTEIPCTSIVKFTEGHRLSGYLLVGVGKNTAEIRRMKGLRYVNGSALTVVSSESTVNTTVETRFADRSFAGTPSECKMNFSGTAYAGQRVHLKFAEPTGEIFEWDYYVDDNFDTMETIAAMFRVRLMASPAFTETWSAHILENNPTQIIIRCQTGYIQIDKPLLYDHEVGEEVLRVVEIYEDGKSGTKPDGVKDNFNKFTLNDRSETFHGVTADYISAVEDFAERKIQPRVVWDAAENERNLNIQELDLRWVDNYRQAAWLVKSTAVELIDGNLPAAFDTGLLGMFHEHGDVVAVRHQTMEEVSWTPFWIENISYSHSSMTTSLKLRLYLSAAFDRRVAKVEKFLESALSSNINYETVPPPEVTQGGYSLTRTGDGAGDRQNDIKFETQPYETFPDLQKYSPHGRDLL